MQRLEGQVSKTVSRLIRQVKVKSGLRLLLKSEGTDLDVSSPAGDGDTQAVFDVLKEKHSRKAQVSPEAIVDDEGKVFHPVIFDSIDGVAITNGAAGLSGLDASAWKRMCTAFKHQLVSLGDTLSLVAK